MIITAKLKIAVLLAGAAGPLALPAFLGEDASRPMIDDGRVVSLAAGEVRHRPSGEYALAGRTVNAPVAKTELAAFAIMKRQVTTGEYQACVDDGTCKPAPPNGRRSDAASSYPVVGVSWQDARTYAAWLSRKTGMHYRLPTDEEWAFAAGDRLSEDALPESGDGDPSKRWLARYELEAGRDRGPERLPQPVGHFGANDRGLLDIAGNVWEWTDTCYRRVALDADGKTARETTVNCGVRVAQGRHRAYVTDFIRDARSGGCAAGTPPSYLGFRLVRDDGLWRRLQDRLAGLFERLAPLRPG